MGLPERESRPAGGTTEPAQSISTAIKAAEPILRAPTDILADLDALAEHLRGRLVVQVEIDDDKFRTYIYRSPAAAQACAERAAERGRRSHITLVQMLPVGVVVGLRGGAA